MSLFQIGKIKIGESLISVDRNLLVIYTIFIGAIIVIFLIKAYLDYQRARFVRGRNDQVISELQLMTRIGLLKKQIQEHFWLEIFDVIGCAYKPYADAASQLLNMPSDFKHTSMNLLNLDLNKLDSLVKTRFEEVPAL